MSHINDAPAATNPPASGAVSLALKRFDRLEGVPRDRSVEALGDFGSRRNP